MDDAGVLADPSDSRMPGINTFKNWTGIHVAAGFNGHAAVARKLLDGCFNLLETRQQRIVIILAAPCVTRDPATLRIIGFH